MASNTTKIQALLNTAAKGSGATAHEAHTAASIAVTLARREGLGHMVARALNLQARAATRITREEETAPTAIEGELVNPLYDMWNEVQSVEEFTKRLEIEYMKRREAVTLYAWAIPTEEALRAIIECGPIVEIGAGSGYWASLLAQLGGDVVAYDQHEPQSNPDYPFEQGWFEVQRGGPEKAAEHADRALFLCWPPYATPFAHECVKAYQGDTIIFVGEGIGGCTADDGFFQAMGKDLYDWETDGKTEGSDEWEEVESMDIPQWDGIHDYLTIYHRKK